MPYVIHHSEFSIMSVAPTTAAEGFPRRAFTIDDIGRMIDAGIIREDEKFELIEGEIVMMAAKGLAHERIKSALTIAVVRALPDQLTVGVKVTLRLTDTIMLEPDIAVFPKDLFKKPETRFAWRSGACDRGRRLEHRLRQGAQGEALCAPSRARAVGDRCQRAHRLDPYRPSRRRMVVDRAARRAGCAHHVGVARLFDPAR